jgi:hypothetical protein
MDLNFVDKMPYLGKSLITTCHNVNISIKSLNKKMVISYGSFTLV